MRAAALLGLVLLGATSACTSTQDVSVIDTMRIDAGDTRQDLFRQLGKPAKSTYKGQAEALQYCQNDRDMRQRLTYWLWRGKIIARTDDTAKDRTVSCEGPYPKIDWDKAPSELRKKIALS